MASRSLRTFTTDEMDDILVRLRRMESSDSIEAAYGCGWKTLTRAVKNAFPQRYTDVMAWRQQHGRKHGGKERAAQRPPQQPGEGYRMYLHGSGVQPAPIRDREAPRWPVRYKEDFSSLEIADIHGRLLARKHSASEGISWTTPLRSSTGA